MYIIKLNTSNVYIGKDKFIVNNKDNAKTFETRSEAEEYIRKMNIKNVEVVDRYHIQQDLMNEFYGIWNSDIDFNNNEILGDQFNVAKYIASKNHPKLGEMIFAVVTGNLNYQVENGGIHQYTFNNYWRMGGLFIPEFKKFIDNHESIFNNNVKNLFEFLYNDYFRKVEDDIFEDNFECTCPECGGTGQDYYYDDSDDDYDRQEGYYDYCANCIGTGKVQCDYVEYLEDRGFDFDKFDNKYYNFKPEPLNVYEDFILTIRNNNLTSELNESIKKIIKQAS